MCKTYLKEDRLRSPQDYKRINKMGCKYTTPHFVLFIQANKLNKTRIGITVSRKVGNAVIRNKIKRYIKEYFRNNKFFFKKSDYSIIARYNADCLNYSDINKELTDFLERLEK